MSWESYEENKDPVKLILGMFQDFKLCRKLKYMSSSFTL